MDNVWLTAAIVAVPLLAGLGLIGALVRRILKNPDIPNGIAIVLGVAALLCVAPTILNLAIKLPGGGEISLVREQLQTQTQQIGEQGADVRRQIVMLRRRVETLEKTTRVTPTVAEKPEADVNKGKVVVVLYVNERKDLAMQMQDYLLQQGYSANAVYTDFTELSDANRLASGTVAFVSGENDSSLRNEVERALRAKFPEVQKVVDASAPKLASTAVQVRLF
ncbi:hypothetical protein JQ615_24465 [Bradyrhizobium jicamae]|uniref:LytR/CpsA/Psr regulator C-terminal domain-containing protein n=1 Tax=Bradyrhizobium jicamae TaxID=280332 RepID=A0ABS5FP14_9BRAD|nr:hypothetical protein [Bradyrhizobium jicamae]MBR0798547.1 hypothetical protein [Bradyrhizobium jicamae]MBR0937183.1 hypothetical protein [Bradyrhizobium jicamae]